MKQLVCEICGGTELRKQNGVFICQSCGCQYTVEEAKKIMVDGVVQVEGTVQVDESNRIDNLVTNIMRTFEASKSSEAYALCAELLKIDPQNPEGLIYSALSDGWQITYSNVSHAVDIQNELIEGLRIAHTKYGDTIGYGSLATTAILQFRNIADACESMCFRQSLDANERASDFMKRNKNAGYLGSDYVEFVKKTSQEYVDEAGQSKQLNYAMEKAVIAGKILVEDAAMEPVKNHEAFSLEMLTQIGNGASGPAAIRICEQLIKEKTDEGNAQYWSERSDEESTLKAKLEKLDVEAKTVGDTARRVKAEIEEIKSRIFITDSSTTDMEDCKARIDKLKKELLSLGVFKGKQKKELQAKIADEEAVLKSLVNAHEKAEKQKDNQFAQESKHLVEQLSELEDKETSLNLEKALIAFKLGSRAPVSKGDSIILFGKYPQSNDRPEPIAWRMLGSEDNRVFLISELGLEFREFNSTDGVDELSAKNWKTSDLKKWLENEFSSAAFSHAEKARIDGAPFCLSVDEAKEYLPLDSDRVCKPTSYAIQLVGGDAVVGPEDYCWWLRTAGKKSVVQYVDQYGGIDSDGCGMFPDTPLIIRPAIWLKL